MKRTWTVAMLLMLTSPAYAAGSVPSAYHSVMQAQYSASAPPKAATPEEAKRIYDAYLKSIGHSTKQSSAGAGNGAETSSH
jgi:hypothetical protein